jgi:hypothetical protein
MHATDLGGNIGAAQPGAFHDGGIWYYFYKVADTAT